MQAVSPACDKLPMQDTAVIHGTCLPTSFQASHTICYRLCNRPACCKWHEHTLGSPSFGLLPSCQLPYCTCAHPWNFHCTDKLRGPCVFSFSKPIVYNIQSKQYTFLTILQLPVASCANTTKTASKRIIAIRHAVQPDEGPSMVPLYTAVACCCNRRSRRNVW